VGIIVCCVGLRKVKKEGLLLVVEMEKVAQSNQFNVHKGLAFDRDGNESQKQANQFYGIQ
jgi:hypothetical protein